MVKLRFGILTLFLILFLLFGCNRNRKSLCEEELNQPNVVKPLLIIDISINGETRRHYFVTPPDKKPPGMHDHDTIFSLYSDGTATYSRNDLGAGPPYYTTKISEEQITRFFDEMKVHGIFSGEKYQFNSGPDSDFIQMYLNYHGQIIRYSSWHELFEDNPNLVATDSGIMPLEGRDRTEVLESCSEDYKEFRNKWDFIRNSVRVLVEGNKSKAI